MPQQFSCTSCLSIANDSGSAWGQDNVDFNRQLRFAEIRRDLVRSMPTQVIDGSRPLAGWRPGADLGTLLIDSWAYVGDVLGFYNNLVGAEAFILTARQRRSLRQLGDLLGYRPQPAVAAQAEVAAIINKGVSTNLDKTAYRASSPSQTFEASPEGSLANVQTNPTRPARPPSSGRSPSAGRMYRRKELRAVGAGTGGPARAGDAAGRTTRAACATRAGCTAHARGDARAAVPSVPLIAVPAPPPAPAPPAPAGTTQANPRVPWLDRPANEPAPPTIPETKQPADTSSPLADPERWPVLDRDKDPWVTAVMTALPGIKIGVYAAQGAR